MEQQQLHLTIGSVLQVQATVPENAPRYAVKLIGYLPGASLIVTTPAAKGKMQLIRAGQRFTVRMLQGNSVVGFVAQVLESTLRPYPHLHLEYPSDFERTVVRNAARANAHLAARVRNTRQPDAPENFREVTIIDLSVGGLKLASGVPLGEVGEVLQLGFNLEVLGKAEEIALLGDIKSASERLDVAADRRQLIHLTGVQFRAANRFQQVLMHAWVGENVADPSATSD